MHMLVTEPLVGLTSLYTSFCFAILFAYFAAYPYVFATVYRFSESQTGLTFLGLGLGVMLAAATIITLNKTIYMKHYRQAIKEGRAGAAPEYR